MHYCYLVRYASDKRLDVKLGGTALLAGGVSTLEAPHGFPQCRPLAEGGVLDVIEIIFLACTGLPSEIVSTISFTHAGEGNNYYW